MRRPPPISTLFPYTTLFRSSAILNFLDESPERKTSFIEISRGGKLPYKTGKECRSEERFSRNAETDLVCRLLLEKKKKKKKKKHIKIKEKNHRTTRDNKNKS